MASDVLGPNSIFNSPSEITYVDHLLESHILDDVEPQYENSEIIRKILQKNSFSKSLMSLHKGILNSKIKEENIYENKEENIYENVSFLENSVNLMNEKNQNKKVLIIEPKSVLVSHQEVQCNGIDNKNEPLKKKNKEPAEETYTSTLSLTIGNSLTVEVKEPCTDKQLNVDVNCPVNPTDDSDDSSFKSSYAKSLIDKFKKSSPQTSPVGESPTRLCPSTISPEISSIITFMQPSYKDNPLAQNSSKTYLSNIPTFQNFKTIETLEKRISSLTDNILMKDKELERLRQEIMFLKLECNRVKTENRNLKVSGLTGKLTPLMTNGDSQHNSLSSFSTDSDVWSLQQQILALNSQLGKAELSRHAYEAATKQLVHFLQTINTTLTTVAGPDSKIESPFTPQNTSELLTNLEMSLLCNRMRSPVSPRLIVPPYGDSPKENFTPNRSIYSPPEIDRKLKQRQEKQAARESKCSSGVSGPNSMNSFSSLESGHRSSISDANAGEKGCKETVSQETTPKTTETKDTKTKRGSPQRRFSISQKLLNSTKKPLTRSGSVSNLPTDFSPIPRVSRAVSSHCVAVTKVEPLVPSGVEQDPSGTSSSSSNSKLRSSKAKDFFSSLRNLFKTEGDRGHGSAESMPTTKKKLTLPALHRPSKVKHLDLPLSSLPHASASPSHTNLKKRNSMKTLHSIKDTSSTERPLHNSIFYVPCDSDESQSQEAQQTGPGRIDGESENVNERSKSSDEGCVSVSKVFADEGRHSSPEPTSRTPTLETSAAEEELSGPQELSVALTLGRPSEDSSSGVQQTPSPTGALALVTGGGRLTGAFVWNEPKTYSGDGDFVQNFSRNYKEEDSNHSMNGINHALAMRNYQLSTVNNHQSGKRTSDYKPLESDSIASNYRLLDANITGIQAVHKRCAGIHADCKRCLSNSGPCPATRESGFVGVSDPYTRYAMVTNKYCDIRILCSLWKLSRGSFRSKGCRLAFV